jgi:lipid A 4'-phosphatase
MNSLQSVAARCLLTVLLVGVLLCLLFPSLDLGVSGLFYTPGAGFEIHGAWYERVVYHSIEYLLPLVGLGLILAWVYGRRAAPQAPKLVTGRQLTFLLVLLAVGPGLIVNQGMKENWGRSRPAQLVEFGRDKQFTRAFELSDQGGKSFPSGHAAAASYLVVVAFSIAVRRRRWLKLALAYAAAVGVARIASGGHFLSDVLVSALTVWVLAELLYPVLVGKSSLAESTSTSRSRMPSK